MQLDLFDFDFDVVWQSNFAAGSGPVPDPQSDPEPAPPVFAVGLDTGPEPTSDLEPAPPPSPAVEFCYLRVPMLLIVEADPDPESEPEPVPHQETVPPNRVYFQRLS